MVEKKFILLVLCVLFMNSMLFAKQQVTIYGDDSYPPYSYKENNEAKGIYVDILKLAFSKMENYEIIIKMIPWKRGLKYIKQGEAFALFPPYHDKDRLLWMIFSEPILKEEIIVFGKDVNLKGKTKWPDDFYGYTIGMNRGFTPYGVGGAAFGDAYTAGKIKIEEANTTEQNLKKLVRDRFLFYIYDKLLDIGPYPSIKRGIVINTNDGHLGFTKKNVNYMFMSDFKDTFNQIIKNLKNSNEIHEIIEKYLK